MIGGSAEVYRAGVRVSMYLSISRIDFVASTFNLTTTFKRSSIQHSRNHESTAITAYVVFSLTAAFSTLPPSNWL